MKALLVILYIIAAVAPALGLILAITNTKKAIKANETALENLLALSGKHSAANEALGWHTEESAALRGSQHAELIAAGAKTFRENGGMPSIVELNFAPNFIENMILKRLIERVPIEIILIILGLVCGATASILSLN